ncbi:unnamed protein product [Mycena citricolor]|uniref:Uncharacterized protein n=1 Tax=Mycena citricolor TaxID=2018698 RepID=A0AAD2Q1B0_9AGAR|nr:unnamed protein product [Mycena citricolor]
MKMTVGCVCSRCSCCRTFRIQTASFVAEQAAIYSASVDDVAVVDCFFDIHEMSPDPRLKQYPETERRVSGQLA